METRIEKLFQEFGEAAEGVKTLLGDMLDLVSSGRVPASSAEMELEHSMETLRGVYEEICAMARDMLPAEEMPEADQAAETYVEAVRMSRALQFRRVRERALETLPGFIAVQSPVSAYGKALAPYQEEAQEFLTRLEAGEEPDMESLVSFIEGPEAFLRALACEDMDSEESLDLIDRLADIYPPRVLTGISTRKYSREAQPSEVESAEQTELHAGTGKAECTETERTAEPSEIMLEENAENIEGTAQEESAEETAAAEGTAQEESAEETAAAEGTVQEESAEETAAAEAAAAAENAEHAPVDFAALLAERKIFLDETDLGTYSVETSSAEEKKISASVFLKEMKKGQQKAEKAILRMIFVHGCITEDYLTEILRMPEEVASLTLQYLLKKGYVRRYMLTPGGALYGSTPRLRKALSYRESSKFAGVTQRQPEDWGIAIDETASAAAARLAYLEMQKECRKRFVRNECFDVLTSSMMQTEYFIYSVGPKSDLANREILIGAFWTKTDECGKLPELLNEILSEADGFSSMIIAAGDRERSVALAQTIQELAEAEIPDEKLYLYVLSDRSYYCYSDGRKIEASEVGRMREKKSALQGETVEREEGLTSPEEDIRVLGEDIPEEVDALVQDESLPNVETPEEEPAEPEEEPAEPEEEPAEPEEEPAEPEEEPAEPEEELAEPEEEPAEPEEEPAEPEEEPAESEEGFPEEGKLSETEDSAPEEEERGVSHFQTTLCGIIRGGNLYAASAWARAMADIDPEAAVISRQLAYALNDPMEHCLYSTETAFRLIDRQDSFENALVIAAAIRTFFSDQVRYDYMIKSFYDAVKDYLIFDRYPALSSAVYSLMEFKNTYQKGLAAYAGYRIRSEIELEKEIRGVQEEAKVIYDTYVMHRPNENASQKRFVKTKRLIFNVNSDIGEYLRAVVDGDREFVPLILEFLQANFYRENTVISEDTIDADLRWRYINGFWEDAGYLVKPYRREDLMGSLRQNIESLTTKAVQLLARWCVLVEQVEKQDEDEGTIGYRRIRPSLISNLKDAYASLGQDIGRDGLPRCEQAGLLVLMHTVHEILDCVEGRYDERTRRYYYAPFLLTDDVMLDPDFLPDMDMHSSDLPSIQPAARILEHLHTRQENPVDYTGRLRQILEEKGDDYGAAELIVAYLSETGAEPVPEGTEEAIEMGKTYAKATADYRKDDFIGELELASSYGQIDNSQGDQKEKILQIIDQWYAWAVETANYGFFYKVMSAYLEDIHTSARVREPDLLSQLNSYQSSSVPGLSVERKQQRSDRIRKMIADQNYTVAEDLLARAKVVEEEQGELLDEDFLKDFLDNYEDYYRPVAAAGKSFESLISSRTRNKEQRGARRLAENWPKQKGYMDGERLLKLLEGFGFRPSKIRQISLDNKSLDNKCDSFHVLTVSAKGGFREHYTHPIAAFGSGAAQEGFRVVCIYGVYNADALIEMMKMLGNTKHTLILLDCALTSSERRRLARKAKNSLEDKMFGVVDRTVMMFLVRHYDETRMNRMLISLITPFAWYQPYVWESANVMPPEIFMGRKIELEKIKSASGANIVYGGRQLGKSALLKKAKDDIDGNENGDRAVYMEIKGMNCQETARKIGHELYDQGVLPEDIDTTDWEVLGRAVKRRLQQSEDRIPYLLLLLDEADTFIDSCEEVNYKPLDVLKDIQSIGVGRFKFVIAGLRNVVRFQREAALANNSVLTHLQSMTVKPFNTSEARELMEVPLHYLGLRFPKEKESLITLILATTNYFPGLIQLYCAKLLEAMRSKDYAGYDEVDTPIYEVSEAHIKKVLADPEFTEQIREKFFITLRLDEDNYYYLIALLVAYLYHTNGSSEGYSAEDVRSAGGDLAIGQIASLHLGKLSAFMEEMRELNVLRSTDKTHYLFARFTFFQMMGTGAEVENQLMEYMEG